MAPKFLRFAFAFLFITTSLYAGDQPRAIADTLAVQEAMRAGREMVIRGEHGKAVEVLEKQLGRIQGDPTFLALLKEAYSGYLKDLELAGKSETLALYRARLAVLEKPVAKPIPTPVVVATPEPEQPRGPIARGARPDEDPFQQVPIADREEAVELLARANQAFVAKQYEEAHALYAKANVARPTLTQDQRSQWAYCIIYVAVAKLNSASPPTPGVAENEIKAALTMVPNDSDIAKFGQKVLQQIGGQAMPGVPAATGPIRHTAAADGWAKAESNNFRLFHNQPQEAAEQIVRLAEQHRANAFAKWAATNPSAWQPICELYVYATGGDYAKATNQPATSPGHSTIKAKSGKVHSRRMDLRADNPNFLGSVLPHEITHVVLGDLFADQPLPRWADEGMAVLSEPRSQVDRYGKTLVRCRQQGQLIPLATILSKPDYPDAAAVTVFYVESVSVVEFLVNQKGPAQFVQFMRDTGRGFDGALTKHYGLKNVAELQDRWLRATFTEVDRLVGRAPVGQPTARANVD